MATSTTTFSNYDLPRFGKEDEQQRIYLAKILHDVYGQLTTLSTSGAPANAHYVLTTANPALTNASVLTAGSGISISGATISATYTSPLTTKGDLYTHSTVDARLPVGADNYILAADSTQPTGLKWVPTKSSTTSWEYQANTGATSGYPGDGDLLWNNATQTSATSLILAHLTYGGEDIDYLLGEISTGDELILQDYDNSGNRQSWLVSGAPTQTNGGTATSYWTIPVTLEGSAGTGTTGFANNHRLVVFWLAAGASTSSSSTFTPWGSVGTPGEQGEPGYSSLPFFGQRPSNKFIIPLMSGSQSTKYDASQKRVTGQTYFNPTLSGWGTSASSTGTLYVVLQTTNNANAAGADLYFEPTSGSPSTIATLPTTTSLTATLLSVDVSAYIKPSANAGIFDIRMWITTFNGNDQATMTDAFIEVTP